MGAAHVVTRSVARGATVVMLGAVSVVLPVATLPAPAARPVAPHSHELHVAGRVDAAALRDPKSLAAAPGHAAPRTPRRVQQRWNGTVSPSPAPDVAAPDSGAAASAATGTVAVLGAKTLTMHFLVAGVTWASGSKDVTQADVRVLEHGVWSPWSDLDVDNVGIAGERPGTDPIVTGGADGVQVRILTADGTPPPDVRVDVIDPGTSPADATVGAGLDPATPAASADAATGYEIQPKIVTRAQWGADESRAKPWPEVSAKLSAMYVHHTAGTNDYSRSQSAAIVRGIYAFHTGARGWPDIGYQFLVDRFGTIYQGRQNAIHDNPLGAQAGGYNTDTIGVSAMGNYDIARPSSALLTGIEKVLAWKAYEYGLNPKGHATLITGTSTGSVPRHKLGTKVRVPVILGHRDTNGTVCPGRYLYAKLPAIRTAVAKRVAAAKKAHGAVHYTTAKPKIVAVSAHQAPVQWSPTVRYTWKPVKGAVKYQVLTRDTSRSGSKDLTDTRYWTVYRTVKKPAAAISTHAGWTRLVAVRAVDSKGRLGPVQKHTQATRSIVSSLVHRSPSWKTVKKGSYYRNAAWSSKSATASLKVTDLKGVRQVVVRAPTGPGYGRLEVRHGSKRLGVLSLATSKTHASTVLVLPLATSVSGTITLEALDHKTKRVSALAFPRTKAAKGVGVSHATPASKPRVVAISAVDAVRRSTATTYTWHAAKHATRYQVWARTAPNGKGYGPWKHLATTTALHRTVAQKASGTTWQVRVRAVGPGGSSAFAHYRAVTRPVGTGLLHASTGAKHWTRSSSGRYYRDKVLTTSAKGATLTITRSTSVKRVRLVLRRGPGEGRVAFYVGGKKVGTRSTTAKHTTWAANLGVDLPSTRSGTVVVRTLDHKPVRISAIALARS
jgi:hypothetical protein